VYHHYFHITCPLSQVKAYMMFWMVSYVAICWPPNMQQTKCVPNVSNSCPHSHMKILDIEGWIKSKWKCNVEVNVKCAMWNEWVNGLTTNHSFAPLPEQEQMWTLDAEKMKSSSKVNLRDVLWCISLAIGRRSSCATLKHDLSSYGPPST